MQVSPVSPDNVTNSSANPTQEMDETPIERTQRASQAAIASLLNLTVIPIIGFIWLFMIFKRCDKGGIDDYHARLGIKINLFAAFALLIVSALIMLTGGLDSPYTWIYLVNYFTLVHSVLILLATWAMSKAWAGKKFREK